MAFTIDDIMKSLSSFTGLGGGNDSNGGAQSFGAPSSGWSPQTQASPYSFGADIGKSLTSPSPAVSGLPQAGGLGSGLGFNVGTGQLALGGLQSLAGIFNSMQANNLAKDQFKFTKEITNANLNNSIKSYNTALGDRANARYFTQNQSQADADKYIADNRLSR